MKFLLIALFLLNAQPSIARTKITISAAISLKEAFKELIEAFQNINKEYAIDLNLAGSGHLRQQIEAGAPVDVFASASENHMQILENKSFIYLKDKVSIARNKLVLATALSSPFKEINFEDINILDFKRISIGNPKAVPAGNYAKEALINTKNWNKIKEKIVWADNVRQVFSYVSHEEVELGVVYYTDFLAHQNKLKALAFIPDNVHSPITYPMALLANSPNKTFYKKWKEFVTSKMGKEILEKHGFK